MSSHAVRKHPALIRTVAYLCVSPRRRARIHWGWNSPLNYIWINARANVNVNFEYLEVPQPVRRWHLQWIVQVLRHNKRTVDRRVPQDSIVLSGLTWNFLELYNTDSINLRFDSCFEIIPPWQQPRSFLWLAWQLSGRRGACVATDACSLLTNRNW